MIIHADRIQLGKWSFCLNEDLYYISFAVWFASKIIFETSAATIFGIDSLLIHNIINGVVFAMLMFQIVFLQNNDLKTWLIIAPITVFFGVSCWLSGCKPIIALWLFIVASEQISFDKVVRITKIVLLIGLPLVILLTGLGVLHHVVLYGHEGVARYSLGLNNPNLLGLRVLQLVLCFIYTDREKIGVRDFVMVLLAACFCWMVPNSQTSTVALLHLFVMLLLYKVLDLRTKTRGGVFSLVLIVGSVIINISSVVLCIIDVSKNKVLALFNEFMSNRFLSGHQAYELFGISFWGKSFIISPKAKETAGISSVMYLDDAYIHLLLRYGIVTFAIFSVLYILGMIYYRLKGEHMIVIILFLYSVYGIMETGMLYLHYNVFLIFLAGVMYDRKAFGKPVLDTILSS